MRIILYLCTRYHAVLAHWGGEGVGAIFIGTASYNACFWALETANFIKLLSKTLQSGCLGRGYITPRQCVERFFMSLRTLYGCIYIIQRREHEFCLFIARVFAGLRDGRAE